jgi:hypothetical protein
MKTTKKAQYHEPTIIGSLLKLGLVPDDSMTIEQKARAISEYLKTHPKPRAETLECEHCAHDSDNRFKVCPFCGDNQVEIEKNLALEDAKRLKREEKLEVLAEAKRLEKVAKTEVLALTVTKFVESDLDGAVAKILAFATQTQSCLWNYANEIRTVHESQLWRLRTAEGKSVYSTEASFSSFVRNELGISVQYAYKLIDVAKAYTPDDVAQVGPTKLMLLLQAPEPQRESLLTEVKGENSSVSEVRDKVASAREKHGKPDRNKESGRKQLPEKMKGKEAKPKTKKIVITDIEGKKRVTLYSKESFKTDTPKPAISMRDSPVGVLMLQNNVFMTFAIMTNAQGEYLLSIDTKREGL